MSNFTSRSLGSEDDNSWMSPSDPRFLTCVLTVAFFVVFGGISSGLQQGFMQMDQPTFNAMKQERTSTLNIRLFNFLEPLVAKRHLTLVTLLISNAVAMESLPLFLDVLVPKYFNIIFSVTLLLIFGEILPQALCLRYPAELASVFAPLVYFLMIFLYPIAYPISYFLDWLLGAHHERTHTRVSLGELVRGQKRLLSQDELDIITGALELHEKVARDICLPMKHVFKLSFHEKLNDKLMRTILSHGHSRVPVWKDSEDNIIGIILVKHLIRINPNDCVSVSDLQILPMFNIDGEFSLFALLRKFQSGASHMAVVSGSTQTAVSVAQEKISISANVMMTSTQQEPIHAFGIVTLEDIIEQLIKRQIEDETDLWKPLNDRLSSRLTKFRSMRHNLLRALSSSAKTKNSMERPLMKSRSEAYNNNHEESILDMTELDINSNDHSYGTTDNEETQLLRPKVQFL